MLNILIIEDEAPARKKLKRFIEKIGKPYTILAEIETVEEAKSFLENPPEIDLILSDIELRDGNVFDVYNQMPVPYPIIFATAYNEFLMNAFEANGIEYLLKPFSFERFLKAWNKFLTLRGDKSNHYNQLLGKLNQFIDERHVQKVKYKDQFAIKTPGGIYFLKTNNIVCFQADNGIVLAHDNTGKAHIMPQPTLKEIEEFLDPHHFFRINRSETVHRKYIEKLERYSKNVISVHLNNNRKILKTSQNKTGEFNEWIGV